MALVIQLLLNFWLGYRLEEGAFQQYKKIALWLMPLLVPAVAIVRLAIEFSVAGNPDFSALSFNNSYFIGQGLLLALAVVMQVLFHFSVFKALRNARLKANN